MQLVDTHAHLDFTEDKEGWCQRAKKAGVGKIICVGTSVEASRKCVEIAEKYSKSNLQIYTTVGIHAQDGREDIKKFGSLDKCIEELRLILRFAQDDKKVVGIGECGLDIRTTDPSTSSGQLQQLTTDKEKAFQKELFKVQIRLAAELDLPLIVHCRNAWEETFESLSGQNPELAQQGSALRRGVFHSWTGNWGAAERALSLGFYISFSGIVTFKNAPNVQEVARIMPLEKMLLETDSPYLSPHPLRGSKNEPKNVKIIAEFIAQLRNIPADYIADITSQNAEELFGI